MKVPLSVQFRQILRRADPLPALALGYLLGLLFAVIIPFPSSANTALVPLPISRAIPAVIGCELPIIGTIALSGLTRLPALPRLPLLWRSLLWGYGSLRMYAAAGRSLLYFQYVMGCGLTLLPLCCLAREATRSAQENGILRGTRLYDYLCRCLFYLGLALLTLPLRLYGG